MLLLSLQKCGWVPHKEAGLGKKAPGDLELASLSWLSCCERVLYIYQLDALLSFLQKFKASLTALLSPIFSHSTNPVRQVGLRQHN